MLSEGFAIQRAPYVPRADGRVLETPPHIAELERLGDEIAVLSAHLDAATARLLDLIRQFDARGGWNTGFRSCAEWLSWRVGLELGAARERVRVAHALAALPRLAEALARGELSYSKIRALTRVATPETEERLLAVGRAGTAQHVERIVRGWRRMDRKAERRAAAAQHAGRALRLYTAEDGTVTIRGRLARPSERNHAGPRAGVPRHRPDAVARGRGAARAGAGRRARDTLSARRRTDGRGLAGRSRHGAADARAAAGRCAGPARRERAAPRRRSRRGGRALPGGGPRRRAGAGGRRAARARPWKTG